MSVFLGLNPEPWKILALSCDNSLTPHFKLPNTTHFFNPDWSDLSGSYPLQSMMPLNSNQFHGTTLFDQAWVVVYQRARDYFSNQMTLVTWMIFLFDLFLVLGFSSEVPCQYLGIDCFLVD